MHLHVELELDFTRRRHWGSRDDELIIAHHSTRFQGCAALLLLMLEAADADLVSPSARSAAPKIFSYPKAGRPITPSIGGIADMPGASRTSGCEATDPSLPFEDQFCCGAQQCSHPTVW